MVTTTLVKKARLQGWKVLEAIHHSLHFNFEIEAAFWLYDEERQAWRLYIVTPQAGIVGPLRLYKELQQIFEALAEHERSQEQNFIRPMNEWENDDVSDQHENLALDDISFVNPQSPIVRDMRRRHGSFPFDRSVVRRVSLTSDEPYIYQL